MFFVLDLTELYSTFGNFPLALRLENPAILLRSLWNSLYQSHRFVLEMSLNTLSLLMYLWKVGDDYLHCLSVLGA
jgi:hypothetical protein